MTHIYLTNKAIQKVLRYKHIIFLDIPVTMYRYIFKVEHEDRESFDGSVQIELYTEKRPYDPVITRVFTARELVEGDIWLYSRRKPSILGEYKGITSFKYRIKTGDRTVVKMDYVKATYENMTGKKYNS